MHDQWLDQWIGLCEWRGANYHHTRWRQTRHAFVDEEAELEEEQDG